MRRPALYSSASHPRKNAESRDAPDAPNASPDTHSTPQPSAPPPAASPFTAPQSPRLQQHLSARPWVLIWTVISLMGLLLALSLTLAGRPAAPPVTQQDINAAVLTTLKTRALPSPAAKAYQIIAASVVSVVGLQKTPPGKDGAERSVRSIGTGVVIVDKGTILTSLHVVRDAQTIQVTFANGLTSAATLTGMQPENDLAVLQAQKIPSDLRAATLHSAPSPAPGDLVMAVGFPFGIGPSASAGVISGLERTFQTPEGQRDIHHMIQFDAAANPGNSGGPLVTMQGEVIGIVTAIYNPNHQSSFVGIGFAVPIEHAASAIGLTPF